MGGQINDEHTAKSLTQTKKYLTIKQTKPRLGAQPMNDESDRSSPVHPDIDDGLDKPWDSVELPTYQEIDLGDWEPLNLDEYSEPLDVAALSVDGSTGRKRRQPCALKAAVIIEQILKDCRGSSAREDRLVAALSAAAGALRHGEPWRDAVRSTYAQSG